MDIFDAVHETDVGLVEDDSPLEGRTVQRLTLGTVADLRSDRVGTDLEGHRAAKALGAVLRRERAVARVRRRILPAFVAVAFRRHAPQHTTRGSGDWIERRDR
jgi:hypothetical protein